MKPLRQFWSPQFEKDIAVPGRYLSRTVGIRGLKESYMLKSGKLSFNL